MGLPTWRWIFLVLCTTVASRGGFAQSVYGTIRGALTLGTGAPITQAEVMVSALNKGEELKMSAQTDASGYYIFSTVPPGVYTMSMRKDGYKTHEEPVVSVSADTTSEVNVKLTQGNPSEKELGDGSAVSILKVDRADVSTSFNWREIDSLPVFLQNMSRYELLVPGAVSTRSVLSSEQNPQNGGYVSISGQHFSGTSNLLDGIVNRDPLQGIVVLNPSLDSVSEVKITTQNYSAEFGPSTGGVVSVQTRSGTNQLHGSAFGYSIPDFGQASVPDFGETSPLQSASVKRTDFGGSLGGALVRNRLFLFGDYRGIRKSSDGTLLLTVPTATVHHTCTGDPASAMPCDLSDYKNAGVPFTSKYPNGTIPNSNVSPEMIKFLGMVPLPNRGSGLTNNFIASGVDSFRDDNFDIRADYVASNKLSTFARYSFADFRENGSPAFGIAGGPGTNPGQFAGVLGDRNQGIATGFSLKLTSSLLTDFRFGFFRYNLRLDSLDKGTTPATDAGIQGLNLGDVYSSGMPDIQLDGITFSPALPISTTNFLRLGYSSIANSCNCPLREREQQFQFVDNWTKLLGKHNIRWGGDVRYLQNFRLSSDPRRAGHLEFSNSTGVNAATGNSLGDFLVGAAGFFERAYNNPDNAVANDAAERQTRMFFYGEDTWRMNSRLSLNYGLRWEIYLPQSVTATDAGGWLQLASGATPVGDLFLVAGRVGSNRQGGVQTTLKNFGPRVGIAYLVNPKTVIRAGYGRSFDTGYAGTIFGIAATQSPPVGIATTVLNGFTLNSNVDPTITVPIDVCTMHGACTVPGFTFPQAPFTISDLYKSNAIANPNPGQPVQQQQGYLFALPRRLRLPTVDAWNVAVQHALDRHTYFEIAYVANKGTHVLNDDTSQTSYYDLNQPSLNGFIGPVSSVPNNCLGNPKGAPFCKTTQSSRQPFQPWTAQVRYFGSDASSNYNSLQIKVRRQLTSGFSMLASYTWSKVLDFDTGYYPINPKVSHGVGTFDRTHSFVMTNTWSLPIGAGRGLLGDAGPVLDRIAGGWSLAAITTVASGLPFTPSYSECGPDVGALPCRPNLVGAVHITGSRSQYFTTTNRQPLMATCAPPVTPAVELCPSGTPTPQQGFDRMSGQALLGETIGPWQRPGAGQIGNAGRNSLPGPGMFQVDLAVAKNIFLTERFALRFRADAFNVFNTVNLGNPSTSVDSNTGGQISSLGIGAIQRQLQFSLRIDF